jgi:hypothetical protein
MHVAACNGWVEVLEFCISNKGDVNAQDEDGNTPLHLATFFLQYEIFPILSFFFVVSHLPFFFSFSVPLCRYKAVEILAKAGASVDAVNRHLETALVLTEDVTMIRLLKAIKNHQVTESKEKWTEREEMKPVKKKSKEERKKMKNEAC